MPARTRRHFLSDGQGVLECFKTIVDGFSLGGSEVHEGAADPAFGLIDHSGLDTDGVIFRGQVQGDVGNLAHFQLGFQSEFKEKPAKTDVRDSDRLFNADDTGSAMKIKPGVGSSFRCNFNISSVNVDHICLIFSLSEIKRFKGSGVWFHSF
jgi:hypothetical protein